MNPILSPYTPSDLKGIKRVILSVYKEFGFKYNQKYDSDLDDPSIYKKSGGIFYVLKYNKEVVGTIAVINKGNTIAELKRLYVDKRYRGKGFGSLLFDKAIKFCRKNSFSKVEFETNKKFTKAHRLYKKRGWEVVKEDEASFYMEKSLR